MYLVQELCVMTLADALFHGQLHTNKKVNGLYLPKEVSRLG
jgi:hypothetical protein